MKEDIASLKRSIWQNYFWVIALSLMHSWAISSQTNRVTSLEKQVNTLGIAVKAAHGEAKRAQRTQGPYLPDPLKVARRED